MNSEDKAPDPALIPQPAAGFVLEELDDELLLFNPEDGRLLVINNTAALIWQLCDGERSVGEITALLGDAFPEAAADIGADVPQILGQLSRLGALAFKK
jgi:hypothetical protein